MCAPLTPQDEITSGFEVDEALSRLIEALTAQQQLGALIRSGASSRQFPLGLPDARIRRAAQEIEHRSNAYQRALCSFLLGEPYRLAITGMSVQIEMQNAVSRNDAEDAARRSDLLRTAMAAVDAAPADAPLPAPGRKPVRDFAALEAGFVSAARA